MNGRQRGPSMSVLGTGAAAGVAQTAQQAQQLARQQAKEAQERQRAAERLRDSFKTRLRGLEQDDAEPETRVHIDGNLIDAAERRGREDQQARRQRQQQHEEAARAYDTAAVALAHVRLPADLAPPTPPAGERVRPAPRPAPRRLDLEA